jgi:ankyrin repeat protein
MHRRRCVLPLTALTLFIAGVAAAAAPADGSPGQGLLAAAERANFAVVEELLRKHVNPNTAKPDGTTALHWAAHHGDVEAVKSLLRAGAHVGASNRYGVAPIWLAARNGHAAVVETLLRAGADPETSRADSGETVLMIASQAGQIEVAQRLIAHGADVNAKERVRGQTALMWAAAEQHQQVLRLLADAGADLEARSNAGLTPLMFAIRSGNIDVTRELLDLGASLETKAPDGTTALVLAIINAHWELARFLLDRGADPSRRDPHGRALHVLTWMRRADNRGLSAWLPRRPTGNLSSIDLAKALLARGADVNDRLDFKNPNFTPQHMALSMFPGTSYYGATPLFIASKNCDVEFMRFLLANGADPLLSTDENVTPLHVAAGIGYATGESPGTPQEALEAVRLLVAVGNDPKAIADFGPSAAKSMRAGWDGSTALHGAVVREAKELVEYLIEQGVPLAHRNKSKDTALDVANGSMLGITFHVYPEIADVIRKAMVAQGIPIQAATSAAAR